MRIHLPTAQQSTDFGLVAWLESTRVTLPLKGVECRYDVIGGIADVSIDQIFHQTNSQPLDCTYTFPLPARAAVYRCVIHVNGRTISARVEAKEDAARLYLEQKAAGRRAMLVEAERENLFTLTLGNVQPGDIVVVELGYLQTLERVGHVLSLRVPVCPGVRYIPGKPLLRSLTGRGSADDTDQVPDASRISPPRIDALHPDAAYFDVRGWIGQNDAVGGTLSSPSHAVLVRQATERLAVELADRRAVPDCDFVVRWEEPADAALTPRAYRYERDGKSYALVQLRAPREVEVERSSPRDYYFLVDRSGSMMGEKWEKACEALVSFVRLLKPQDRVWITLFESDFVDFAEKPITASVLCEDPSFHRLVSAGTTGGTEFLPAAQHVLGKIRSHSRPGDATLLVITDGEVGNEEELLAAFAKHPDLMVHTFGIDTTVNDALLHRLAERHGGECWLLTPNDDIAGAVAGLGSRMRQPVFTDVMVKRPWTPTDTRLRSLFGGQVSEWCLTAASGKSEAIKIVAKDPSGRKVTFEIAPVEKLNQAVALLWAREQIAAHEAKGERAEAIKVAREFNLLCEGAAFVAWDEEERVPVAAQSLYQPALAADTRLAQRMYCLDTCRQDGLGMFEQIGRAALDDSSESWNPSPIDLAEEHLRGLRGRVPPFIIDELRWIAEATAAEQESFYAAFVQRLDAAEAKARAEKRDQFAARLEASLAFLREHHAREQCLEQLEKAIARLRRSARISAR